MFDKIRVMPILTILLVGIIFISIQDSQAFATSSASVGIALGSSVPGCEATRECYIPYQVTVDSGGEVTWYNSDSAAHTVTSGYGIPDGNFDSSLFMAGTTFSVKFDGYQAGTYPYFCMVHPWMTGEVIVIGNFEPISTNTNVVLTPRTFEEGKQASFDLKFIDSNGGTEEHVNYDVVAKQGSTTILDDRGAHLHSGVGYHTTAVLNSDQRVDISVTFRGYGIDPPFTGQIQVFSWSINPQSSPNSSTPSITVKTDRGSYKAGDVIRVTGEVGELLSGTPVSLQIIAANGNIVGIEQVDVGYNKKFSTEISYTDGNAWRTKGTYAIKVLYGTQSRTAETTFEFGGSGTYETGTYSSSNTFKSYADTGSSEPNDPSQIYSSNVINTKYSIDYRTSTGRVLEAIAYDESNSIVFQFYAIRDGQITVILPRELIDSKINGRDDSFFVLVNGEEVDFSETKTSYARTLIIPFSENTNKIEIIGSSVTVNTPQPAPVIIPTAYPSPTKPGSDVILASGSSVPGCEETKSCYIPYQVTVDSGGEVTWYNADSAAHTVTSGTGADGPDGNFDSSLFMAGTTFSVKFDDYRSGTYPYFCMVHPWMTGEVIVLNDGSQPAPAPTPIPKPVPKPVVPPSPPAWTDVILGDGTSVPGCEETNSCFIPAILTVNSGESVVWFNQDSAAHTVTSGTAADGPDGNFDSSLFMSGTTFSHTFDKAGSYPYFCMVHPWMTGQIRVSGSETTNLPVPKPVSNPTTDQNDEDLSKIIEENKKLREELERQGTEIDNLNKQVDYLSEIINSIKGFFGSIFS